MPFATLLISTYGVAPSKVHVIPGAVDTSWFKPARKPAPALSSAGRRVSGLSSVVRRLVATHGAGGSGGRVCSGRQRRIGAVRLFIGGKGPLQGVLESQIRSLGLGERVRMLGFISESLLPAHYQAADISIVPSQTLEGFGLTTLESLACGTPVLVTPVGGLTEVVGPLAPGLRSLRDSSSQPDRPRPASLFRRTLAVARLRPVCGLRQGALPLGEGVQRRP